MSSKSVSEEEGLSITILSSDTTSLLDTDETCHLKGVTNFWKRIEHYFHDGKIENIRIVFVTGTAVVAKEDQNTLQQNMTSDTSMDKLSFQRAAVIATLLKSLERSLESKAEEIFKKNRSHIMYDAKFVSRMDISLTTTDRNVGFHRLLQQWSNDFLATASTIISSPTLRFQLPETIGFDSCSINFRASYKVMPFPMNSPFVQRLYYDLEMLSRATFETLQLVPMSSICSTLLYGMAISLRVGLGNSMEQHHENLLLAESLFKMLGEKDCALLVVATCSIDERNRNVTTEQGLFHSASLQHFLLMPEFIETSSGKVSNKGVLYRIASADYLLESNSAVDVIRASNHSSMDQMDTNPYEEFVEASLDSVTCAPLNPLCVKTHDIDPIDFSRDQKRVTWNNDVVKKQVHEDFERVNYTMSQTESDSSGYR